MAAAIEFDPVDDRPLARDDRSAVEVQREGAVRGADRLHPYRLSVPRKRRIEVEERSVEGMDDFQPLTDSLGGSGYRKFAPQSPLVVARRVAYRATRRGMFFV